jgi:hypothetical protein
MIVCTHFAFASAASSVERDCSSRSLRAISNRTSRRILGSRLATATTLSAPSLAVPLDSFPRLCGCWCSCSAAAASIDASRSNPPPPPPPPDDASSTRSVAQEPHAAAPISADQPSLFTAWGSARALISKLTTSAWPPLAARRSGVSPERSATWMFAPALSRHRAASSCPAYKPNTADHHTHTRW